MSMPSIFHHRNLLKFYLILYGELDFKCYGLSNGFDVSMGTEENIAYRN